MSRTKLILSIASVCCLLFAARGYSQQPEGDLDAGAREARLQMIEAEFDLNIRELEFKMSEREVEAAKVEILKSELNLKEAEQAGEPRRVEFAKLEMKQKQIGLEMRMLRSEMARLELERAKARLALRKPVIVEKREKRARVQLEYDDDLDIVVIRGARDGVDKVKALIEKAFKEKQEQQ